jgi:hypothetical protein
LLVKAMRVLVEAVRVLVYLMESANRGLETVAEA